ncbi:MAG: peptidoglycan-binding protein [Acidobacteriota bacterium]
MPYYKVRQGDCVSSIAEKRGFTWQTIWDHPDNASLKRKRKDPNVLLPGDQVFIPEKRVRQESGGTEQRHSFRKKGVPAKLRLRVLDDQDQPRANEPYTLEIDGKVVSGSTDSDGRIECPISPSAAHAKLLLGQEEFELALGNVDPIEELTGVQARLNNLGFDCGQVDGKLGSKTEAALRDFQAYYGLKETGEPDDSTRKKLVDIYGS